MKYEDRVGAHLQEDTRILKPYLTKKKLFSDDRYEIHICIYAGISGDRGHEADLVTLLVSYKKEALRLMLKYMTAEIPGDVREKEQFIDKTVVRKLEAEERGPFHIIRDAKQWCNVPFTPEDKVALSEAGIKIGNISNIVEE